MIYVYVFVPILLVLVVCGLLVLDHYRKKNFLTKVAGIREDVQPEKTDVVVKEKKETLKQEVMPQKAVLEDFALPDMETKKVKPAALLNEEFEEVEDDFDIEDDEELSQLYEEFLGHNRQGPDNKLFEELMEDEDYDLSSLKKDLSDENVDIAQVIKNLSPKLKDMLLLSLLSKKNLDDF